MHDGSIATLREVVELYNRGGEKNPYLDPKIEPLRLSPAEVDALVAFMEALDGEGYQDTPPTRVSTVKASVSRKGHRARDSHRASAGACRARRPAQLSMRSTACCTVLSDEGRGFSAKNCLTSAALSIEQKLPREVTIAGMP